MNYYNQNEYEQNLDQNLYQIKEETVKDEIDVNIRLGFIRKVYGILTFQLLITSFFTLCCMSSESIQKFLINQTGLFYLVIFVEIILCFIIIFVRGITRSVPLNYFLLLIFTLAESYIVGFICSLSNPKIVFMAACMTFAIVVFLTIYAMTTKTDITTQGSILFLLLAVSLCLIVFNIFLRFKFLYVIICCISVFIFGIYIIYDTQLILGKKNEILKVDDYILGSFLIYTDIISLFLNILSLLNIVSSN